MTKITDSKPKTVQEAVDWIPKNWPSTDINRWTIREAMGLDDETEDPEGLDEAVVALEEKQETESKNPNPTTQQQTPNLPMIVRLSDSQISKSTTTQSQNHTITPQTTPSTIGDAINYLKKHKPTRIINRSAICEAMRLNERFIPGLAKCLDEMEEAGTIERLTDSEKQQIELKNFKSTATIFTTEEQHREFVQYIRDRINPQIQEEKSLLNLLEKRSLYEDSDIDELFKIYHRSKFNDPIFPQSNNHTITIEKEQVKSGDNTSEQDFKELLSDIREWASEQQGETAAFEDGWYVSPALENFITDIAELSTKIWVVKGLSGSGKSTTQQILNSKLRDKDKTVVIWKLHQSLSLANIVEVIADILPKKTIEQIILKLDSYIPRNNRRGEVNADTIRYYLAILRPYQINQALASEMNIWSLIATKVDFLLIDLPDYNKDSQCQMNKDLQEIHDLWERIKSLSRDGYNLNIVLFLQQEMCEANNHFFLKKATVFTLQPLKPIELVNFYTERFGDDCFPFNKEALELIASKSGGTWRRFKKLIEQCLNPYNRKGDLKTRITVNDTNQWIDPEIFAADRELEFSELFPKSKTLQQKAAKIVSYLEQHQDGAFQSEMTHLYFGDDETAEKESSRFFKILQEKGKVESEFRGRRKYLKLKTINT